VLVDNDVQINSKFTPEGFIELGGLTTNGTRIFIGRSPDSDQEEIIAFVEQHGISSVASKPLDATVLYGWQTSTEEQQQPVEIVETAPSIPIGAEYAWFSDLPDGNYYSDGQSLFSSGGELLGPSVYPVGNYVRAEGQGFIQHGVNDQAIYLPVDTYNGDYVMSGTYKNQFGETVPGSELSFEFLTGLGLSPDKIDVPYVFPGLFGQEIQFTVAPLNSGDTTDSWERFVFIDGKVVGKSSFDEGDYFVQHGGTYKKVDFEGTQLSQAVDTFDGELLEG
ncbi:MAG: hypothetical protein ACK5Q1_05075, partial [Limnobacter sp.]